MKVEIRATIPSPGRHEGHEQEIIFRTLDIHRLRGYRISELNIAVVQITSCKQLQEIIHFLEVYKNIFDIRTLPDAVIIKADETGEEHKLIE